MISNNVAENGASPPHPDVVLAYADPDHSDRDTRHGTVPTSHHHPERRWAFLLAETAITWCDIILGLAAWEFAGSDGSRWRGYTAARSDRVQAMTPMLMMYTVAS